MANLNIDTGPPEGIRGSRSKPPARPSGPSSPLVWIAAIPLAFFALCGLGNFFTDPDPQPAPAPIARRLDANSEAVEVATLFERHLKAVSPAANRYVAMVDIAGAQGYLIVFMKEEYNGLAGEDKAIVEDNIVARWRESKWVSSRGWDPSVEFKDNHPDSGFTSRFNRPTK